jgi:NitT/TauT family transport system ATP-binding protein/nitrate/nitrite transport system substrate-binding protein
MLPPLALAACAGLRGPQARLIVPMALSQGGNTITVRSDIADAIIGQGSPAQPRLRDWLRMQPERPRFAVVHVFSTHNLLLRYWLASSGIDPDGDVEIVVIPPETVGRALAEGRIAGFCAGAPWGDVAEQERTGRILIGTSSIWPFHPEKCLCVAESWAGRHPGLLGRLLRAILHAQVRCDGAENAPAIAALLADPCRLGLPREAARAALPGGGGREQVRFPTRAALFPAHAHAEWFLGQMIRWGWMPTIIDAAALARQVYRPEFLAPALDAEGLHVPEELPALTGSALLPLPGDEAFGPRSWR